MTNPYYADMKELKRDADRRVLFSMLTIAYPKPNDGFHIRHGCVNAFEEELKELHEKVAEEAKSRKKMVDEMKKMREDIKLFKELCIEGVSSLSYILQNDGFHNRHRCFDAIEEKLQEVKEEVAEEARIRKKMEDEMKKMLEDIKLLKELYR
ncbi:unnamed protein product [Brassica napus]|nr:unnamed protein product [Brassica napus]